MRHCATQLTWSNPNLVAISKPTQLVVNNLAFIKHSSNSNQSSTLIAAPLISQQKQLQKQMNFQIPAVKTNSKNTKKSVVLGKIASGRKKSCNDIVGVEKTRLVRNVKKAITRKEKNINYLNYPTLQTHPQPSQPQPQVYDDVANEPANQQQPHQMLDFDMFTTGSYQTTCTSSSYRSNDMKINSGISSQTGYTYYSLTPIPMHMISSPQPSPQSSAQQLPSTMQLYFNQYDSSIDNILN
jgi:hypothetical protein